MRGFVLGVIAGISAAAISQELKKDPEHRTWKGHIGGIPYNFRVNDWQALAKEYWNPESDQILSEKGIGIGWSINFAALTRRAQEMLNANRIPADDHKVIDAAPTR